MSFSLAVPFGRFMFGGAIKQPSKHQTAVLDNLDLRRNLDLNGTNANATGATAARLGRLARAGSGLEYLNTRRVN